MGRVVISIDAELAWGYHDLERPPDERIRNARTAWRRVVDLFDEYSIPATWAVVGHLLLEECDGDHADHPLSETGWFESDPGTDATAADRWYGPDLVDAVRTAAVDHEIACHTFSHAIFDPDRLDEAAANAEVRRCVDLAAERDLSMESFVFPRNVIGFRETLARHGFTAYRGIAPPRWYDDSPVYPIAKVADFTVGDSPPPIVTPEIDEYGLVNVPASLYLFSFERGGRPLESVLDDHPVVRQAKLAVDEVADADGVAHLWFHPNNLTEAAHYDRLREVLSYVATQRARGRVDVETMAAVARRTRARNDAPELDDV